MIISPSMLVPAAMDAGMEVPAKPHEFEKCKAEYPHFFAFCVTQLGRPVRWGEHWDNAKVIAGVPKNEILTLSVKQLIERGLEFHTSKP